MITKLKFDKFTKAYLNLQVGTLTLDFMPPNEVHDIIVEANLELAINNQVISVDKITAYNK